MIALLLVGGWFVWIAIGAAYFLGHDLGYGEGVIDTVVTMRRIALPYNHL